MSVMSIPCPACGQALKVKDRGLLGRKVKCPKCAHAFVLEEPPPVELEAVEDEPVRDPFTGQWLGGAAPDPFAAIAAAVPDFPAGPVTTSPAASGPAPAPVTSGVGRLREIKRQNAKRRWLGLVFGLVFLGLAGGGGYWLWAESQRANRQMAAAQAAAEETVTAAPAKTAQTVAAQPSGVTTPPTTGTPIPLELIPAGARVVLHLRPAELWAAESPGEEFRYCLGPVGEFLEANIKLLARRPAADIEELLIAWIPGQRGTAPDNAVVVRLKAEARKSELLDLLGGDVQEIEGRPVYMQGDRAAVILNTKTYAIGPAAMAAEMVGSIGAQNPSSPGIEGLIEASDRLRHVTLVFEPTAVLLDAEFLAPAKALPLLRGCMDWFGDDAEAVAWSLHLEPDRTYSQVLVRNNTNIRTVQLEEKLLAKLGTLPKELVETIGMMQPREQGKRQLIGRLPAMTKVVSLATLSERQARHVTFTTALPDRAAPNLALGTLLAWDESTRTNFQQAKPATPSVPTKSLPEKIADRLKQKIDVDFRRTPLDEAVNYLGSETGVTVDIDGDSIKLAALTQNVPQTFKLDQVPATEVLKVMMKNHEQLQFVIDEEKKLLLVTSRATVEERNLGDKVLKP
jgi:predicted Zn finger-like uncharacterized protein